MSESKSYYAFISYKREDKKEAKRLQHTLEYYRLPNKLRQENPDLPEYVRPIFRDMTDLEVGELSKQIHEALEQSHYLIVVCSPRAAKSKWVNDEVDYFISLGKQDKIIPFIIDGLPHADNPNEECYPPALLELSKEKELLGANINEVGKESAAIRVVSRMFNIRFDTLYQRYRRERRRLYLLFGLGIFSVIASLAFLGARESRLNQALSDKNQKLEKATKTIEASRYELALKNVELDSINQQLSIEKDKVINERDRVKAANWKMLENQSRSIAAMANQCFKDGDIRLATLLAIEVLPRNVKHPDRPWTREADAALREASSVIQLIGHTDIVRCASFSPNGNRIASASLDSTIRIWDANSAETICIIKEPCTENITSVSFSPDNIHMASSSYNGHICIWNSQKGQLEKTLYGNDSVHFHSVVYNSSGSKIAALYRNHIVYIWDATTYQLLHVLQDEDGRGLRSIAFDSSSSKLVTIADSTVLVWDTDRGKIIQKMPGHAILATDAKFSPDGNLIASSGYDSTINIWKANTGECIRKLKYSDLNSFSLDFSPNGKHLASIFNDEIQIWNIETGTIICNIKCHSSLIGSIQFSPDGEALLTSSHDGTISIWRDYRTYRHVNREQKYIYAKRKRKTPSIFFSADSLLKAVEKDEIIYIYDTHTNKCLRQLAGISIGHNLILGFSSDNNRLAAVNAVGSIHVWDLQTGSCIYYQSTDLQHRTRYKSKFIKSDRSTAKTVAISQERADVRRNILSVFFSSDGKTLNVEYADNDYIIWLPPIQELIDNAIKRYQDYPLTSFEKKMFYLE